MAETCTLCGVAHEGQFWDASSWTEATKFGEACTLAWIGQRAKQLIRSLRDHDDPDVHQKVAYFVERQRDYQLVSFWTWPRETRNGTWTFEFSHAMGPRYFKTEEEAKVAILRKIAAMADEQSAGVSRALVDEARAAKAAEKQAERQRIDAAAEQKAIASILKDAN